MNDETKKPLRRLIGVSLGARTTVEAEAALREIAQSADIAEIRLDFMVEYDLPRLLRDRPCPVIVTNRPEREGGRYRGSEAERVKPLLEAIDLGADYVDVEHDATHLISDRQETRLIVSYHDFQKTPANFVQLHRDLAAKGADVVKIVGMAQRVQDNLLVFDALVQSHLPTIAIAMGEAGLISRILALRYDTCLLTYATLGTGERVAPGQLAVATMHDVFHADKIDGQTAIFGVLSAESPPDELLASLNLTTREAGMNGVWVPFVAGGRDGDDPADVLRAYRQLGVSGYLILESARRAVLSALDAVESRGPRGDVNVVRSVDEGLVGSWASSIEDAFGSITGHRATIETVSARL
jgi:3-dehydroquinate dehydratase/shikimate dehydrogenase